MMKRSGSTSEITFPLSGAFLRTDLRGEGSIAHPRSIHMGVPSSSWLDGGPVPNLGGSPELGDRFDRLLAELKAKAK